MIDAMKAKQYVVMTVECPRCKTEQNTHVAVRHGVQKSGEKIPCLTCDNHFKVTAPVRILGGPFTA
jgi:transcription elongation factor Elf1